MVITNDNNRYPMPPAWASYRSIISIVFGLEFDFEFVMAALVAQKELHHFQEHKAFDHFIC